MLSFMEQPNPTTREEIAAVASHHGNTETALNVVGQMHLRTDDPLMLARDARSELQAARAVVALEAEISLGTRPEDWYTPVDRAIASLLVRFPLRPRTRRLSRPAASQPGSARDAEKNLRCAIVRSGAGLDVAASHSGPRSSAPCLRPWLPASRSSCGIADIIRGTRWSLASSYARRLPAGRRRSTTAAVIAAIGRDSPAGSRSRPPRPPVLPRAPRAPRWPR